MAHALDIQEEGQTALSLTTTNWVLRNYTPQEAEVVDLADAADAADTDLIGDVLYRRVTETIELYCYAASKTALQTAYRVLEALVFKAQQFQRRGAGNRVFLGLQVDGEASRWQSEIISGRLEMASDALALYANVGMNVRLTITRRAYFEIDSDVLLSLTSSTTAATTAGVAITNTYDANWVGIAAAQVTGLLPTPLKVEIKQTSAAIAYHRVQILNNASIMPASYDAYLTAAETTDGNGTLSATDPTGETILRRWMIPTATLDLLKGAYVRVLVALTSLPTGAMFRGIVESENSGDFYTRYRGTLVDADCPLVDLGLFPLPPGGKLSGYYSTYFGVGVRYNGALSTAIHHMLFVPSDGERRFTTDGFGLNTDDLFVDDPFERSFYIYNDLDAKKANLGAAQGGPLWVYPGVNNRFYVLSSNVLSYSASITQTVRAWCRPRRLTI